MNDADLDRLLGRAGLSFRTCRLIEERHRPGGRLLLRLAGPNGEPLKVRSLASRERARSMVRLRRHIGDRAGFARLLAYRGPLILEEWVEGACLAEGEPTPAVARASGALLAELHRVPLPCRSPGVTSVASLVASTAERLTYLRACGFLPPREACAVGGELAAAAPRQAIQGVLHFDFCGENLVVARGRGVVSIDNEGMRVGPLGYDIGRTLARWALRPPSLEAFLEGYGTAGGPAEMECRDFWILAALITSAWYRVRCDPERAEVPLQALRERAGS